jgi:hypothetical protein
LSEIIYKVTFFNVTLRERFFLFTFSLNYVNVFSSLILMENITVTAILNTAMAATNLCTDLANLPGYIPAVSTVTGLCRIPIGKVMIVAGLVFATLAALTSTPVAVSFGLQFAATGLYNMGRGSIEAIPVVGNGIAIALDIIALISMGYPSARALFFF